MYDILIRISLQLTVSVTSIPIICWCCRGYVLIVWTEPNDSTDNANDDTEFSENTEASSTHEGPALEAIEVLHTNADSSASLTQLQAPDEPSNCTSDEKRKKIS